jgi:hypothetical protein
MVAGDPVGLQFLERVRERVVADVVEERCNGYDGAVGLGHLR